MTYQRQHKLFLHKRNIRYIRIHISRDILTDAPSKDRSVCADAD